MLTHILVARLKLLYKTNAGTVRCVYSLFSTDEDFNCLDLNPEKKKNEKSVGLKDLTGLQCA